MQKRTTISPEARVAILQNEITKKKAELADLENALRIAKLELSQHHERGETENLQEPS